nr:ethylene-responsive transcription factor ERF118-like [Ipomoea batatas]
MSARSGFWVLVFWGFFVEASGLLSSSVLLNLFSAESRVVSRRFDAILRPKDLFLNQSIFRGDFVGGFSLENELRGLKSEGSSSQDSNNEAKRNNLKKKRVLAKTPAQSARLNTLEAEGRFATASNGGMGAEISQLLSRTEECVGMTGTYYFVLLLKRLRELMETANASDLRRLGEEWINSG